MIPVFRRYLTEIVWLLVLAAVLCFLPADARSQSDKKESQDIAGDCLDIWDDCGF